MPPVNDATTPPHIPDYALLRMVGRGSYGDVWLARSATGLFRAVKIVWRARFQDIAPYEREFNGLREFAHITAGETQQLSLLHVGRNERAGFFYYVMELADDVITGREIDPSCYEPLTFRYFRDRQIVPPARDVVSQATELARGLVELHSTGHVHRDIKPSNIIVVHGRPKLADIGLVTLASEAMTYVGTEGFVPPEGPGTAAADIYSFGKVLYELATGRDRNDYPRLPENFGSRDDRAVLLELNEIILKACAPRPEERYPDVESMLGDLQLIEAGRSVRRLRRAEAGLARARRWIIAAAAIATIAAAGALVERQRAERESAGRRAAEAELADLTRRSLYASSIANAQRALETGEFGAAREALARAEPQPGAPDLRGFEWHVLAREAAGDEARSVGASTTGISNLVFTPDGRQLAIDDASTDITFYDVASLAPQRTLRDIHRLIGFSADGQRLVGSNPAFEIETWSFADGVPDPRPNAAGVHRPLAIDHATSRLLAFVDGDDRTPHRLILRDLATDRDLAQWVFPRTIDHQGTTQVFHAAAVDPGLHHALINLSHLRLGLRRHFVVRVDLDHPEAPPIDLNYRSISGPAPMAFSPDGETYLLQSEQRVLSLHRTKDDRLVWQINLVEPRSINAAFSPNHRWVAVTDLDRRTIVLDVKDGRTVCVLKGHGDLLTALAWSPDSRLLASGTRTGEVRLWPMRIDQTEPIDSLTIDGALFNRKALVVEHRGRRALDARNTEPAAIIDLHTGDITPGPAGVTQALWFESNQLWWVDHHDRVVSGAADGSTPPRALDLPGAVKDLSGSFVSPDGHWLGFVTQQNELVLWERVADRLAGKITFAEHIETLGLNNLGQVLLSNDAQQLQLWDLRTGLLLQSATRAWGSISFIASPDSRWWIAVGTQEGSLVLDAATLEIATALGNSHGMPSGFAFSPDSRTIATGGSFSNVLLFRLSADGRWLEQPSLTLPASPSTHRRSPIVKVVFTPDGAALAACTAAKDLRIWRR